jgi:catechol 2,3-dioxygenase-like lactoylglutathione lyase family enzyme
MINLNISDVRTFLPAKDYALSKAFYVALGWELKYNDDSLARLENAGHSFYIQNYSSKEWADNCMLHITVADAQSCWQQVSALIETGSFPGVRVSAPKQEPYGALVTYVWDPSGVLLHLAQWTNQGG